MIRWTPKSKKDYLIRSNKIVVTEEQKRILNQPFSINVIVQMIKAQKNGKAPGPDGLLAECYKTFEDLLLIPYKRVLEEVEESGSTPASWNKAIILLIHKSGTDEKEIKNYQPILNDYKIYVIILTSRLKKILADIIQCDQTAFLPKQYMRNNVRPIINVLEYYELHMEKKMALAFLDEKAFDNVNWLFLLQKLEQIEVGEVGINSSNTHSAESKTKK